MLKKSTIYNIIHYCWIISYLLLAAFTIVGLVLDIHGHAIPKDAIIAVSLSLLCINSVSFTYLNDHLPVKHKRKEIDNGSTR